MTARTAVVLAAGAVLAAGCARAARRSAVADRFPPAVSERRGAARLAAWLATAEVPTTPAGLLQVWAAAIVAGGVLGFTYAPQLAPLGSLGAAVAVPAYVEHRARQAPRRAAARLPELLDAIATELRAGGTIVGAIGRVDVRDPGWARLVRRLELGADAREELQRWAGEHPSPDARMVAGALGLAVALGGPSADALGRLATSLRDRIAIAAEARGLSAQARVSAVVIGGAPFAYLAISTVLGLRAVDTLVGTPIGWACLVVGLALEAAGAVWMRHILRAGTQW